MDNATHLGLDVHKDTIAVAVLRPDGAEPDERTIPNTPEAIRTLIRHGSFEHPIACYEAGATGYETYRLLTSLGVACDVVAPTMIPRRSGARVKTDRIDARNLARLHRAGELTPIRVPSPAEEALRDLVRVREDIKDDRRKTQHRVKPSCCAKDVAIPAGTRGWTDKFDLWARSQRFEEPASDAAYRHYLAALDVRRSQLVTITAEIEAAWRYRHRPAIGINLRRRSEGQPPGRRSRRSCREPPGSDAGSTSCVTSCRPSRRPPRTRWPRSCARSSPLLTTRAP
ncbi:hypothetical protein BH18ACT17_BH18ACT17_04010 [soil metagenome]